MCTVTFIPAESGFVLTSSRDELNSRPTSKASVYEHHEQKIVYPKDELANGTWIATNDQKKIACLLNGGIKIHSRKDSYRKSRGNILIESFIYKTHTLFIESVDLIDIEPFTLLLIDFNNELEFFQLVWDGEEKHIEKVDPQKAKIWSSVTLYSPADRMQRKEWFRDWLTTYSQEPDGNMLQFHSSKHSENSINNILMNREGGLQTVSISQIIINANTEEFKYFDLLDQSETKIDLLKL